MKSKIEELFIAKGLKMTDQRKLIVEIISSSTDHPDAEEIYNRAMKIDKNISIATVYRTVKMFEAAGIIAKHDFGDGKSRYEQYKEEHHDHLIDMDTGNIIEFHNEEIEKLQFEIAEKLGYKLIGHKLELYAVPRNKKID